jgi:chromatin assembly factor 1 subunit A
MADPIPLIRLSPGVKRSHDEFTGAPTADPTPQTASKSSDREASPAPSTISSLSELTATTPQPQLPPRALPPATANGGESPTKKRKLTFAERQVEFAVQKMVKDEKAKVKAQEKAEKEEKKRLRDEEKRKKAEEKEAENRQKEMKKAEKDAEKAKKDAEKAEKQAAKDAERVKKEQEKMQKEQEKLKKERVRPSPNLYLMPTMLMSVGSNAAWSFFQSSSTSLNTAHDSGRHVCRRCV